MGPNRSENPAGKAGGQGKGKGKGKGKGGKGGKGANSHYNKQPNHYYSSKRPVGGKGIFITTVRGKESRCAGEAYDLLDEVADRLYPPERIAQMQQARLAWINSRAEKGRGAATAELAAQDGEDEDFADADTDEASNAAGSPPPPPQTTGNDDDSDDDDDLDIEASIQKELAALKAGHGGQVAPAKARRSKLGVVTGGDGDKDKSGGGGKQTRKERPRFQSIQTDTECREFWYCLLSSSPRSRRPDCGSFLFFPPLQNRDNTLTSLLHRDCLAV